MPDNYFMKNNHIYSYHPKRSIALIDSVSTLYSIQYAQTTCMSRRRFIVHRQRHTSLYGTHGYVNSLLMSKENGFPAVSVPAHWHPLALIVHVVAARPRARDETQNQMASVDTSAFAILPRLSKENQN